MDLNHSVRLAFAYLASSEGESLADMPSVGPKSIDDLIKLGLVEIAVQASSGKCYRLTKAGYDMYDELSRLKLIPLRILWETPRLALTAIGRAG